MIPARLRPVRLGITLAALVTLGAAHRAHAEAQGKEAMARLERGESLVYEQTIERHGHRYVGGVAYAIVPATAGELEALFDDADAFRKILPATKDARRLDTHGDEFFVELRHGNAVLEGGYTLFVRREFAERTVRFWVDRRRPRAIDDAWGFFRYAPLGPSTADAPDVPAGAPRALLAYGVLVDVGPGLVRVLFEERVRRALLSVPWRLRRYVATTIRRRAPA